MICVRRSLALVFASLVAVFAITPVVITAATVSAASLPGSTYSYDSPTRVVMAAHGEAAVTTTTPTANDRATARPATSGARASPGVVRLVSDRFRAAKAITKGVELDARKLSRPDLIGRPGRGPDVRELDGDAADVYSRLAHGADDAAHPTYAGPRARLDDGTIIGLRQSRKYGPTLDVNPANGPAYRIHFK